MDKKGVAVLGVHIIIVVSSQRTARARLGYRNAPPPDRKQNSFRPNVGNGNCQTSAVVVVEQHVMCCRTSSSSIHPSFQNPLQSLDLEAQRLLAMVDLERCPMHCCRRLPVTIRSSDDVAGEP